jgi:NADH-quinone oxidoreductase subunit M
MMDAISDYPVLTVLTFWPTLAAILLALTRSEQATRVWTLVASLVEIALAWPLLSFQKISDFQFQESLPWAPEWGLSYSLGVDGVSILMIWLSILTLPVCVLCSWTYIGRRIKEFHVCLLLMTTACVGVFSALDMVLFYVFWEALLIPMYLMIAIWGGDDRRYASIKFFLYTLAGSTLLLVAIVALRIEAKTFFIPELMNYNFSYNFQIWVFLAFFIAFAIKVPMFPFHTWLPAAHVQAPAAGSVILAAVLLKMGTYGFLRFSLPMTPAASQYFAPMMIAISVASILYGGAIALGQTDIKKLIAYSSVAHMGFVTLGIFVFSQQGVQGAIFQMLNHGIITGAMFTLIGAVYERSHSRDISKNLGLGKYLPAFMFFWGLFGLASFGFPGTNGFVGEFLVLAAAFRADLTLGLIVIPGALLAAAYILKVTLKLAWGQPASPAGQNWRDLKKKEWAYLVVPAFLVIYLGLAPSGLLEIITPSIDSALASYHKRKDLPSTPSFTEESLAPVKPQTPPVDPANFTFESLTIEELETLDLLVSNFDQHDPAAPCVGREFNDHMTLICRLNESKLSEDDYQAIIASFNLKIKELDLPEQISNCLKLTPASPGEAIVCRLFLAGDKAKAAKDAAAASDAADAAGPGLDQGSINKTNNNDRPATTNGGARAPIPNSSQSFLKSPRWGELFNLSQFLGDDPSPASRRNRA